MAQAVKRTFYFYGQFHVKVVILSSVWTLKETFCGFVAKIGYIRKTAKSSRK